MEAPAPGPRAGPLGAAGAPAGRPPAAVTGASSGIGAAFAERLGRRFPVPDEVIMDARVLVDASLAGLAQGASVCCPSLEDATLLDRLHAPRADVLAGIEASGRPAPRYVQQGGAR